MKPKMYISDETREGKKLVIKGSKLTFEWLDSYLLVHSEEEHK